eukprot:tig00000169_g11907.t1
MSAVLLLFRQTLDAVRQWHEAVPTDCPAALLRPSLERAVSHMRAYVAELREGLAGSSREASAAGAVAEEVIDFSWERLHIGPWNEVDVSWRETYALGTLVRVLATFLPVATALDGASGGGAGAKAACVEAMRLVDMGLMMGGPRHHAPLEEAARVIQDWWGKRDGAQEEEAGAHGATAPAGRLLVPGDASEAPEIAPERAVPRMEAPHMDAFRTGVLAAQRPAVLTGAMEHWPALTTRPWADLAYLKRRAGLRTVPVELGSHYLADGWGQKLMTLSEFIDRHVLAPEPGGPVGYLAQHQLFEQIPELRGDIAVPEYCYLPPPGADRCAHDLFVNAWFGPKGTVSPCHTDPYDNLLAQVVGRKYLRLYPPEEGPRLYPHEPPSLLTNTSQADVERADLARFPLLAGARCVECVLGPGEMLFIPRGWWHYVRSLDPSFSVSFWWR